MHMGEHIKMFQETGQLIKRKKNKILMIKRLFQTTIGLEKIQILQETVCSLIKQKLIDSLQGKMLLVDMIKLEIVEQQR